MNARKMKTAVWPKTVSTQLRLDSWGLSSCVAHVFFYLFLSCFEANVQLLNGGKEKQESAQNEREDRRKWKNVNNKKGCEKKRKDGVENKRLVPWTNVDVRGILAW